MNESASSRIPSDKETNVATFRTTAGAMTAAGQTVASAETLPPTAAWAYVGVDAPAGSTFVIEASQDGTAWSGVGAYRLDAANPGQENDTITLLVATRLTWLVRHLFGRSLRVRCTGLASGTMNARVDVPIVGASSTIARFGMPPNSPYLPPHLRGRRRKQGRIQWQLHPVR